MYTCCMLAFVFARSINPSGFLGRACACSLELPLTLGLGLEQLTANNISCLQCSSHTLLLFSPVSLSLLMHTHRHTHTLTHTHIHTCTYTHAHTHTKTGSETVF